MDNRKFLPFIITRIILIFVIKIINSSLTDELLKMRGIEATTSLANSSNAKVVVCP